MTVEIEAKFVHVDVAALRQRLSTLGATLVHGERLMRRKNFDFVGDTLETQGGWVRLRDEGDKVTLAYKETAQRTLHGTKEVSVVVASFELAEKFLGAVGLTEKAVQETKRERWQLEECEVTIDTWPWLPPFVELEGPDEKTVRQAAAALQLDFTAALHGSVEIAYQQYYDVTDRELQHWPSITFGPVPDWLQQRRRG